MKPSKPKSQPRPSAKSAVKTPALAPSAATSGGPAPSSQKPKTILLAVTGMSPAVLTETVWALAHPKDGRAPCVPEEVVAITTLNGLKVLKEQLQQPSTQFGGQSVWQALRNDVLGPGATEDTRLTLRVEVINKPDTAAGALKGLEDLRNGEDSLVAAQFILQVVRQHTSAQDRTLIASLAGGRKTMSALLHAAVSHLGRPGDRITHILVHEDFETRGFFFPTQTAQALRGKEGKPLKAADACLELADVPFVPLRIRFPDIAQIPSRFGDLVRAYSETFKHDASAPAVIELLTDPPRVVVDGQTFELEGERQLVVIRFLLEANQKHWLLKDQGEALEIFKAWHGHQPQLNLLRPAMRLTIQKLHEQRKGTPGEQWITKAVKDDIKRPLSFLRKKLEHAGAPWIPPQRDLRFPPFRLAQEL